MSISGSLGKRFRFARGSKVRNVGFFYHLTGAGSLSMIRVYGVQLVIGCNLELGSTGLSTNLVLVRYKFSLCKYDRACWG